MTHQVKLAARCLLALAGTLAAIGVGASMSQQPSPTGGETPPLYFRLNLLGYLPVQAKQAVVFSAGPIAAAFDVVDAAGRVVLSGKGVEPAQPSWGEFAHHRVLDFTALTKEGDYRLRVGDRQSAPFRIARGIYGPVPDVLLEFLRQQRCGYNPFLDAVCHMRDGRSAFAPAPDGTYVPAWGGWHDAADSLKYLLTSSNATAQLLLAWRLAPKVFGDTVNDLGQPGGNGEADVLDEARWGLEWMLRLHPAPNELYHQVGDDRDHSGWRLPPDDESDYGWGKGGYRVVYFATGTPQGLRKYQSESNGIANLAGRYAAAMAMAYQTWRDKPRDAAFAARCLRAGLEVYEMGRRAEGVQQGNSYGSPYRYNEETWADDMEWGAAELYRATRQRRYLDEAMHYARMIKDEGSWMGREGAAHYQFYPFMNAGHFALFGATADPRLRAELAGYYRAGLERAQRAAAANPYLEGAPFIWCSNNLVVALATQGVFYEMMTGQTTFADVTAAQRDWLLGRNPWGTSMFTVFPAGAAAPADPHLITADLTHRPVRGGLVDGPVAEAVFKSLKGVTLSRPDAFAPFQSPRAVYHDDRADYSTNEPTMDGTASAVLLFAVLNRGM